jgi:hypothetical protein
MALGLKGEPCTRTTLATHRMDVLSRCVHFVFFFQSLAEFSASIRDFGTLGSLIEAKSHFITFDATYRERLVTRKICNSFSEEIFQAASRRTS